jgi:hypothetical protein
MNRINITYFIESLFHTSYDTNIPKAYANIRTSELHGMKNFIRYYSFNQHLLISITIR